MAVSIQDQQRIFLAYRALFEGQKAQVRQPKTIRKILKSSKISSSPLVRSLGFDKVLSVLRGLLEENIFSSELKAKLAFPVLYETSPEQDARHEASDVGAAREEAEALQGIEALDNAAVEGASAEVFEFENASLNEERDFSAAVESLEGRKSHDRDTKQVPNLDMPSLYPVQLPFKVQYSILTSTQRLLEECCYNFTQKYAPDLLVDKNWDCAEAIELNKWTLAVIRRYGKLPAGAFKRPDHNVHQDLLAVIKIRHAAVHRLHISAKGLVQMLDAAIKFAETLSDLVRTSQLEELYRELKSKLKSQELNKNYLETKLKDELREIQCQHEELAKRGREAISSTAMEDEDHMHFIGTLLEGKLRNIFGGDNVDDEVNGDQPNDQLGNAKDETTDDDPGKDNLPKESESPQLGATGIEISTKRNGAEVSTDLTRRGSTGKESSISFQHGIPPSFKYTPFTETSFAFSHSPFVSANPEKYVDDLAEKSPAEETSFAEPAAAEPQPEPTEDETDVRPALMDEQPVGESESKEFAPVMRPEIEPLIAASLEPAIQHVSIADAIQNILKDQNIDTSYLRKKKSKSKKKLQSGAYNKEMGKIGQVVSENLRHQLQNGTFEDFILEQIEEFWEGKENRKDPWAI